FDRHARIDGGAGITTRNYTMLSADVSLPYLWDERLELGAHAVFRHNPQEDFWGLGPDSAGGDRVTFGVDYTDYQARVIVRPLRWLVGAARFGSFQGTLEPGTDRRFPSI